MPVRLQAVVEDGQQLPLQFRPEVDQQIAAAEQVQLGERRVLDDVLRGEDQHLADRLLDPVLAVLLLDEIALESARAPRPPAMLSG